MKTFLAKIRKAAITTYVISKTKYKDIPLKYMLLKIVTTIVKLAIAGLVIFFVFSVFYGILVGTILVGALLGSAEDATRNQTSIRSRRGPFV